MAHFYSMHGIQIGKLNIDLNGQSIGLTNVNIPSGYPIAISNEDIIQLINSMDDESKKKLAEAIFTPEVYSGLFHNKVNNIIKGE